MEHSYAKRVTQWREMEIQVAWTVVRGQKGEKRREAIWQPEVTFNHFSGKKIIRIHNPHIQMNGIYSLRSLFHEHYHMTFEKFKDTNDKSKWIKKITTPLPIVSISIAFMALIWWCSHHCIKSSVLTNLEKGFCNMNVKCTKVFCLVEWIIGEDEDAMSTIIAVAASLFRFTFMWFSSVHVWILRLYEFSIIRIPKGREWKILGRLVSATENK